MNSVTITITVRRLSDEDFIDLKAKIEALIEEVPDTDLRITLYPVRE